MAFRLNFNLSKEKGIKHHSWKEHNEISKIAKFGCEMLCKGPYTPDAIRQRDANFPRFSLTDNFDPSLNFPNI
jgi:hypothetical protein